MTEDEWKLAEWIASNEDHVQACILVKYGVPFDVAMSLRAFERFGLVVIFKQMFESVIFDFSTRSWRERPPPKKLSGG